MNQLSIMDLRELSAKGQQLPDLQIVSSWLDLVSCLICNVCKPEGMVKHLDCMRTFCAPCATVLLEQMVHCAYCRGPILDLTPEIATSKFYSLPPNDVSLIDNLEFKCEHCDGIISANEARTHANICDKNPRFQPPAYIHDMTTVRHERRYSVSNPVQPGPASTRDRLIIFHHNGNQIGSYFLNGNWPIYRVKQYIARRHNLDANEIDFYRFFHEKLDNDEILSDIARGSGSTHLTSVTQADLPDSANNTVFITVLDAGAPPLVPNPNKRRRAE